MLINWIEAVARAQGYGAQVTSVAGVAQRTGATVYYIDPAPAPPPAPRSSPLMPSAGGNPPISRSLPS